MAEGFTMKLCGAKGAYQIVPEGIESIDLAAVGGAIVVAGFEAGVQSRLCWTFTGDCDMTLYPSGKLMVRTEDVELAAHIAQQHITSWVHA